MVLIYVLKLEQGKYYVGKTNNPYFRLNNHFNSNGSAWTTKYKPMKVLEIKSNCDHYDEDKITKQYMDRYGIDNVRGGSFVSIKLEKSVINTLKQMNNGTNNKCFVCGKGGHFAKECGKNEYWETGKNEYWETGSSEEDDAEYDDSEYDEDYCFRCGREGHHVSSCYASTHIKGYYLK